MLAKIAAMPPNESHPPLPVRTGLGPEPLMEGSSRAGMRSIGPPCWAKWNALSSTWTGVSYLTWKSMRITSKLLYTLLLSLTAPMSSIS